MDTLEYPSTLRFPTRSLVGYRPPPALPFAVPGTARCYPRAIRACAIYPFVRRAVPSPHPLPASRSPTSTSACASAAIKIRTVSTTATCPAPHWSSRHERKVVKKIMACILHFVFGA
ncbi:hypothetical protein ALC56_11866 [Trachymyrmex septentrionalis]|uniref:Uncharacterized protein n=1 Tax=Trachymyrmex septentrionalis TaxID=34720 RepID=A0A195EZQ7_9HYME|nr:hypothetical protein ALC56_11866 [Trachymyrmex septentrionalis]